MKVKILTTPGCTTCVIVEKMLKELKIKYEVIDVTKKPEILKKYPIFAAPGIVIDNKLYFTGVPKKMDLKKILEKKKYL